MMRVDTRTMNLKDRLLDVLVSPPSVSIACIWTEALSLVIGLPDSFLGRFRQCFGFGSREREVVENVVFPHVGWKYDDQLRNVIIHADRRFRPTVRSGSTPLLLSSAEH